MSQYCDLSQVCVNYVADGGACAGDLDCQLSSICRTVCMVARKPGETCSIGAFECQFGDYCNGTGRCATQAAHGAACGPATGGEPVVCGRGWCDLSAATPTCRPYKAVGQACTDPSLECGPSGTCVAGFCEVNYCGIF